MLIWNVPFSVNRSGFSKESSNVTVPANAQYVKNVSVKVVTTNMMKGYLCRLGRAQTGRSMSFVLFILSECSLGPS
jgi:hypothetical protein